MPILRQLALALCYKLRKICLSYNIYSRIRNVNLQTNASYSTVNEANHQAQQDPLYAMIDDQDSAHYTEPPRDTHLPYYQEIQTDGKAAATAYKIPAGALVSVHQQPGGVVSDIAPILLSSLRELGMCYVKGSTLLIVKMHIPFNLNPTSQDIVVVPGHTAQHLMGCTTFILFSGKKKDL